MATGKVIGVIPARGGSKGIPRKNIRSLDGQPLIEYTIDASLQCPHVDETVVSTDDDEIATVAEKAGASVPFIRPNEFAQDETPTEPVIEHALEEINETFETFVLLQPTSPLRGSEHIEEAIELYVDAGANSLVSVYEDHSYRWNEGDSDAERVNYSDGRKRRQEKATEYIENGAIYIADVDRFLETGQLTAGRTKLYPMSKYESIDINEPVDLQVAEALLSAFD